MRKRFLKGLNFKEKEVKKMKKGLLVLVFTLVAIWCTVGSVFALPSLLVNEPTKLKFTNFEYLYDNNANNLIDAGDRFVGIFNVTSIHNVDDTVTTWSTGGSTELTGIFSISVQQGLSIWTGLPGINPNLVDPGYLSFTMNSGDFLEVYYDTTPDWLPGAFTSGTPEASQAWTNATDGALYMATYPSDYLEGYNETSISQSFNRNWVDLTVNNTGYPIIPMLWPETLGATGQHIEWNGVNWVINPNGHVSDVMFETHLYNTTLTGNWMYRSEDPVYLYATPEPATMLLFGSGLIGLAGFARRRISRNKK